MSNEIKMENSAEGDTDENMSKEDDFVVRIRGLPWSSSKDDIVKFFSECKIKDGINGIHMTMSREGRPSGNAYVEFESEEDVEKALKKDNQHIGQRYIEVFRCKKKEMKMALRRMGIDGEEGFNDACVRLRGLPFGCSKEEIAQFFTGLEIVRNGITLPTDFQGRSTGEAYVQFASQDIAEKAMGKHKEKIGHRYIEIFKSSLQEIRNATGMGPMRMRGMAGSNRFDPYERMDRPGPGGQYGMPRGRFGGFDNGFRRPEDNFGGGPMFDAVNYPIGPGGRNEPMGGFGGGDRFGPFGRSREPPSTGHRVHMRGLPYRAVEQDIFDFFKPLKPVSVRILYEPSGRSSGEADVEFFSHDEAVKAMKKDKEKIQHRYIELFLHSEAKPFRREMETYGPDEGRPFGPGMDRQFGPGSGERGFGPDADRRFDGGYGGFPSGDRPFGGPAPERGFGSPPAGERPPYRSGGGGERGYNVPSERPFGPAADRYGSSERPFGPATERFGSSERPFGPATERFGSSSERPFGPATERFGAPAEKQPYSAPADRYGSSTERPFGPAAERFGPSGERPFMSGDRSYGASDDRPYGDRSAPSGGDPNSMGYRNGMSQGYGSSNTSTFRNEGRFGGGLDMVHSGGLLPDFPYPSDVGSKTMWKRKERIGLRYIEIVKSSFHEIRSSTGMGPMRMRNVGFNRFDPYERISRPGVPYGMLRSHYGGRFEPMGGFGRDRFGPLGRGREPLAPGPGHHIHMRGLPFRAGEQEIYNFFKPLKPVSVRILYDTNGRSTGEAHVEFFSRDEALKAMKKDKEKIQHRYIELFLQSESKPLLSLEDGRPLGLNVDRQFGPGGGDRGYRPNAVGRYDSGYGSFASGGRPFEGVGADRSYRPPFGERSYNYNLPPERPFGSSERFGSSAQRFGPQAEKPYSAPTDRFGSSTEKPFGSANKRFGASGERSYGVSEDRSYGVRGAAPAGNLNSLAYNGVNQSHNSSNFSTFRSDGRYGGGTGPQLRERSNYFSTGKMYTKSTYPLLSGHGGINSMIGGSNYHAF